MLRMSRNFFRRRLTEPGNRDACYYNITEHKFPSCTHPEGKKKRKTKIDPARAKYKRERNRARTRERLSATDELACMHAHTDHLPRTQLNNFFLFRPSCYAIPVCGRARTASLRNNVLAVSKVRRVENLTERMTLFFSLSSKLHDSKETQ